MNWKPLFSKVNENNYIVYDCELPKKSGIYICTCIRMFNGQECGRYIKVKAFDKERNTWHDIGNKNAISDTIISWCDVDADDRSDFIYQTGGYIIKKNNN